MTINKSLKPLLNYKRNILLILAGVVALLGSVCHADVTYILNDIEISEEDYNNIDKSLIEESFAIMDGDTGLMTYRLKSSVFASIDTRSKPGHVLLTRKPQAEIDLIYESLSLERRDYAVCKPGEQLPDLRVVRHTELEDTISIKSLVKGKVAVIHFWFTYGQDYLGLSASQLPEIIAPYVDNSNFVFIPINVNPIEFQLENFLNSGETEEYGWLKDVTFFDRMGRQSLQLSNKTHPFTVVVDRDGIIRYNEVGEFSYEKDAKALSKLLSDLLRL